MTKKVLYTFLLAGLILPALSDTFRPSHSCSKPYKPIQFNTEYEVEQFNMAVERYKRCINDFVEEQMDEAEKHQEAANEAIQEWNNFVNWELS